MTTHRHTVLFVDDEPEIVDSLRRTLRDQDYRVVGSTSPVEALRLVLEGNVDVLVADIDMPEMNGLELVSRVRQDRPEVVRMLLTGDASLESALQAINDGEVHRYLTKPWDKDDLRDTIRRALDRIDELRRLAEAGKVTRAREALLADLAQEHPGITTVVLDEGVYVVDDFRLGALLSELHSPALKEFFEVPLDLDRVAREALTVRLRRR